MRTLSSMLGVVALGSLLSLSAFAGRPVADGFYDNAKGSPVVDLINGAQSSIDMEIYEMDNPRVLAAIRAALERGVTIHIVKEPKPVGAACKVFSADSMQKKSGSGSASCEDQQQLVDDVNQAGGKYVPFATSAFCENGKACLEHGKIVVIDSDVAMVTSGNFNTTNLCDLEFSPTTCNRDYSYVTRNPDVVSTLQTVVEKDIAGEAYDVRSVMAPVAREKLTVGPDSLDPLVTFIQSAHSKIQIENQYLKDPTVNDALIASAKRGVDVEVIVASACSFGKPKASEAKRLTSIFSAFDAAGITTRMFNKRIRVNGEAGYLHAKAIVIDGEKAWMGSVNGSTQALTRNREFGAFFENPADVQRLASVMSGDFDDPNEESWQDSLNCAENRK